MHISLGIIFIIFHLRIQTTCSPAFRKHSALLTKTDRSGLGLAKVSLRFPLFGKKAWKNFRSFSISPSNPSFFVQKNGKIKQPSDLITRFHFQRNLYFFDPELLSASKWRSAIFCWWQQRTLLIRSRQFFVKEGRH